jgi:hypothetical protein
MTIIDEAYPDDETNHLDYFRRPLGFGGSI